MLEMTEGDAHCPSTHPTTTGLHPLTYAKTINLLRQTCASEGPTNAGPADSSGVEWKQ